MTIAVSSYSIALAVHIMAVVSAFGLPLAYPLLVPYVRRAHPEALPGLHEVQYRLNQRITAPGTVVVLLLGAYLTSERDAWGEPWVLVGLAILVIIGGLGGGYVAPATKRLAALAREDHGSPQYDAALRRYLTAETLLGVLVLVAIFFMAAKPFA